MTQHRFLVIVCASDASLHEAWLVPAAMRSFDLLVCYGGSDPERFHGSESMRVDLPGAKWNVLSRLFEENPGLLQAYDRFWLPDDDIETDAAAIDRLFAACEANGLLLGQPSLGWNSAFGQVITLHHSMFELRTTNFIEPMAPCFSSDFLRSALPTFTLCSTGAGLGHLWPALAPRGGCAVIDKVQVVRAPAADTQAAVAETVPGSAVLQALAAAGVQTLQAWNWGGLGHDGTALSLSDASRDDFLGRLLAGYAGHIDNPAALGATYLLHFQQSRAAAAPVPLRPRLRRSPIVAAA